MPRCMTMTLRSTIWFSAVICLMFRMKMCLKYIRLYVYKIAQLELLTLADREIVGLNSRSFASVSVLVDVRFICGCASVGVRDTFILHHLQRRLSASVTHFRYLFLYALAAGYRANQWPVDANKSEYNANKKWSSNLQCYLTQQLESCKIN